MATPEGNNTPPEVLALIHYRLGYVERKKMSFTEAAKEFGQAVQYAPNKNEYRFELAKTCYEAGDYLTADREFVKLLNSDPNYPEGQYYYGLTLLESVNRTNALQPLAVAVGELEARALLTDKYYAKGELEQGLQSEEQLVQIATRLGRQVPELKHKAKAFGSSYASPSLVASAPVSTPIPDAQPYDFNPGYVSSIPAPAYGASLQQGYLPTPPTTLSTLEARPNPNLVVPTTESTVGSFESYSPSNLSVSNATSFGVPSMENSVVTTAEPTSNEVATSVSNDAPELVAAITPDAFDVRAPQNSELYFY